jgi:ribosome-binding factor A
MEPHRAERISEALREELGEIIAYEMADPRLSAVMVTDVHVAPDLRHAHVRIAVSGDAEEEREAIHALDGARNYLRRQLVSRIHLYRIPDLHFQVEPGGGGERLQKLLKRIRKGRPREEAKRPEPSKEEPSS